MFRGQPENTSDEADAPRREAAFADRENGGAIVRALHAPPHVLADPAETRSFGTMVMVIAEPRSCWIVSADPAPSTWSRPERWATGTPTLSSGVRRLRCSSTSGLSLPVLLPLAPAVSVAARFPSVFAQVARRLEVIPERLAEELGEMSDHALAKTSSRRMLGVMNGYAQMADQYRWTEDKVDLIELSCWLAETSCGPLFETHVSPDRALQAVLS